METHRLAATGPVVLTERTDTIVFGRVRVSFWVCGTFEVVDGRIVLWRDYFDWAAMTGGVLAGLGRGLASLARRKLSPVSTSACGRHGSISPREGTPAPSGGDAGRSA